jgi:hypothetical protein
MAIKPPIATLKIKNSCGARMAIFTNWAFGGLNAQFAKVQV